MIDNICVAMLAVALIMCIVGWFIFDDYSENTLGWRIYSAVILLLVIPVVLVTIIYSIVLM